MTVTGKVELVDFDVRQVELFVLLARHRHYGAAAREASVAQPALSQQIKRFESLLGLRLFDRTSRTVSLTAAGRVLLPLAEEILTELTSLERLRHRFDRTVSGAVRLGLASPIGMTTANAVAAELAERLWGKHELQLVSLLPHQLRQSLIDRTIDFALTLDAGSLLNLGGVSAPVAFDPRSAVLPRTHPLARARRAEWNDLRHDRPLDLDPSVFGPAALWSPSVLDPAEGVIHDLGELRDAIILGRGICLLPDPDALMLVDDSITRVPVVDVAPVSYALVWWGTSPPLPEELLLGTSPTDGVRR